MFHPFQLLAHARPLSHKANHDGYLLLAEGSQLLVTSLQNLTATICWSSDILSTTSKQPKKLVENNGHAAKRQKTENAKTSASSPRIIKLALSPNNDYVILVTEDKCVHVLAFNEDGSWSQLSRRTMPKRPCAIQILPDNATILCGDKFGDVYSLPLVVEDTDDHDDIPNKPADAPKPVYKPAASHLTVHSKRNRDALEAQIKQAENFIPSMKEPLKFKHELLLGHVSMLTDLTYASQKLEHSRRNFIITADRDEHIRISRAAPQAHIIEGYCLGHTQYISKISLLPKSNILVSGGGDDWIGVWDWPSYKLVRRLDIKYAVRSAIASTAAANESEAEDVRVNVAGIWPCKVVAEDSSNVETFVVVSCEKVPALFVIPAEQIQSTDYEISVCSLNGKVPLDVVTVGQNIIVAVDERETSKRLIPFRFVRDEKSVRLVDHDDMARSLDSACQVEQEAERPVEGLDDFLYTVSNMRKWRGGDDEADPEADGDGDVGAVE